MKYLNSLILLVWTLLVFAGTQDAPLGSFEIWGESGVAVMHAALLSNGKLAFLDKVEDRNHVFLPNQRPAYACVYDPATNDRSPLVTITNPFCCAGAYLSDGRLISIGGNGPLDLEPTVGDGFDAIRYLDAEGTQTGWEEPGHKLSTRRWYATAQVLSDGTVFVVSGSLNSLTAYNNSNNNPTYEILDKNGVSVMPAGQSIPMNILERNQPYFMYPFLFLLKTGDVVVVVNTQAQIFQPADNQIVKELPDLPGAHRTYPSTGGAVMLPLTKADEWDPEIMICGGGFFDAFTSATDASCGRLKPLGSNPTWNMTYMPEGRVMIEGVNLLDGTILWINGAKQGAEGFGMADKPAYDALIYNPAVNTWTKAGTSTIARLYHSVALLLPDGTVLVSGSNPNEQPRPWPAAPGIPERLLNASDQFARFPTDYRVEIWTPPYLQGEKKNLRPTEITLSTRSFTPGDEFVIRFRPAVALYSVDAILYAGGFVTHALHMGQVMYKMENRGWWGLTDGTVEVEARIPAVKLAPGPYWVYVVANGVPGMGEYVLVEL